MPGVYKHVAFDIDVYALDMAAGGRLEHVNAMVAQATLDYPGPQGALESITLYDVSMDNGIAIVDYDENAGKMRIIYLKNGNGIIESPAEVSEHYTEAPPEVLERQLSPLLAKRENPRIFVVSSATYYDNSRLVKLMLMDTFLKVFER